MGHFPMPRRHTEPSGDLFVLDTRGGGLDGGIHKEGGSLSLPNNKKNKKDSGLKILSAG
jgi:hypothetical protein